MARTLSINFSIAVLGVALFSQSTIPPVLSVPIDSTISTGAAPSKAARPVKIVWYKDLDIALTHAKAIFTPVFVYSYDPHCGFCEWMDTKVFSEPRNIRFLMENFLCVSIFTGDGNGKTIATNHHIGIWPSFEIMHPDGYILEYFCGYKEPSEFLARLKSLLKQNQSNIDRARRRRQASLETQ